MKSTIGINSHTTLKGIIAGKIGLIIYSIIIVSLLIVIIL